MNYHPNLETLLLYPFVALNNITLFTPLAIYPLLCGINQNTKHNLS